eukprot:5769133-Pleurochrysis_carterae.AAC.1
MLCAPCRAARPRHRRAHGPRVGGALGGLLADGAAVRLRLVRQDAARLGHGRPRRHPRLPHQADVRRIELQPLAPPPPSLRVACRLSCVASSSSSLRSLPASPALRPCKGLALKFTSGIGRPMCWLLELVQTIRLLRARLVQKACAQEDPNVLRAPRRALRSDLSLSLSLVFSSRARAVFKARV